MSEGLSSITEPVNSIKRSRTSSCNSTTEGSIVTPLILSPAKSSKTVRFCTLCGHFKGFQMQRYLFITLCIAITLLILLLGILLVFYVIIPAIVRSTIAKTQLGFRSVSIENIENDHFRLRAELELSNTGSIPATILPPFIIHVGDIGKIVNNESITIRGNSSGLATVPIDSSFFVSNLDAFHNFSRSLIFESNVVWELKSEATIRPIASFMPSYSKIPFNKKVSLGALNGLPNVSIGAISLSRSDAHHVIADLTINITNPSVFSIDLGELFFSLQYNNWSIGYVESSHDNITIHPGENAIQCWGELKSSSSESYNALSAVIQNFLTGRTSKVEALAGPNATSHPLLAAGMMGLALSTNMPPFDEQLIVSLEFVSTSLIPSTTEKKVSFSSTIIIKINSPLGQQSPLSIQTMGMSVALFYDNDPVGMLNVSQISVKQLDPASYETSFENKYLILTDTGASYEKFTRNFINANKTHPVDFRIVGVASIVGSFALGPVSIDGILVENNVSLVGLDGLSNVHVDGISVDGEEGAAIRISVNATIQNPGITNVQLQNFSLYMADGETGTVLGHVPVDILAVQPGSNEVALHGFLAPLHETDLPTVGKFFSAYLNGKTQAVKLYHNETSVLNASALDLTISGLTMKANLDGIQTTLIREVNILDFGIEFDRNDVNKVYVSGRLSVLFELPSNVHMTFKALTTSINFFIRFNDGPNMGQMILQDIPVQHNQTTNEILMSFSKQEIIVLDKSYFEEFAANIVLTTNVSITIQGLAAALANIRIGNISLSDIPVTDTVNLVGFNQFDNGLLKVDNIDIIGDISSQAIALRVKTEITNPSVVNIIYGGRLTLDLCDNLNGISLGIVNIDPFYLDPQENTTIVDAEGIFNITEQNSVVARQFVSNMVSGIDSQVELRGTLADNTTGTSIPLLSLAIGGLRIHTKVPGLTGDRILVRELLLKKLTAAEIAGIPLGIVKRLSVRVRLVNPFSSPIIIQNMNMRADFGAKVDEQEQVGVVHDATSIPVAAHQEFITNYVNVTITAKLSTLVALIGPLLSGHAHLSLSGATDVKIGNEFVLTQLPLTVLNVSAVQESSRH